MYLSAAIFWPVNNMHRENLLSSKILHWNLCKGWCLPLYSSANPAGSFGIFCLQSLSRLNQDASGWGVIGKQLKWFLEKIDCSLSNKGSLSLANHLSKEDLHLSKNRSWDLNGAVASSGTQQSAWLNHQCYNGTRQGAEGLSDVVLLPGSPHLLHGRLLKG